MDTDTAIAQAFIGVDNAIIADYLFNELFVYYVIYMPAIINMH